MKFRAKPVEIEAVQFTDELNPPPGVYRKYEHYDNGTIASCFVNTAGGPATVWLHDWIVKEPSGSGYYPVRPDIFESKYEKVEQPE